MGKVRPLRRPGGVLDAILAALLPELVCAQSLGGAYAEIQVSPFYDKARKTLLCLSISCVDEFYQVSLISLFYSRNR